MASSIKPTALGFGSGCGLTVHEFEPHIELHAGSEEPAWDSLSLSVSLCLSLSAPTPFTLAVSLK